MFIDDQLNISSTKFDGSKPTRPNLIFKMNFDEMVLEEEAEFKTKENPYYFGTI